MKDISIWRFIHNYLRKNERVILVVVLQSTGSSPGKAGFKMAVSQNEFSGTIGGGEMEYNLIKQCRKILKTKKKVISTAKLFHNKKTEHAQSGLICAGTQTNLIYSVDEVDFPIIKKILKIYKENRTEVLKINNDGIALEKRSNREKILYSSNSENEWLYEENVGITERIYIFGGGHVGLALSRQMELLDFHVVIFDDRDDLKTIQENKYADEIIICEYESVGEYVEEGISSYAAVVTTSFPNDIIVLKQLSRKNLKYIGLMGSPSKIKKIFKELETEGVSKTFLKKIKTPIGIPIHSETVEEIALSIAAEIVKIKNEGRV